jgi:ribosomal-protein-alanine N-acetyltransferase
MITEIDKRCIVLKELKPGDEQDLVKYASHPDVARFLRDSFPYPYTLRDAQRWIHYVNHIAKGYFRAIELNNEVVGCIGVELQADVFCKSAELGYWIGQRFWRKGIMTHVVKKTIEHAFFNMDIVRLYANVFEGNIGSVKVLEKAGFVQEAVLKDAVYKNGVYLDQLIFTIVRR